MSDSRSIGSLIVKLVAQGVAAYKADVDAAAGATDKAANAAKRLDGELASQTKQVKAADSAMQMLASSGKAVASALVAWKVVETVGKLVSVQREFDVLNSSLITVTGSSARAAQEFDWIKRFAATTPYQLNEVTGAFVKMKALGLDASEKALTSYGNTASAMGKGLNQMIEAVADASTGEFERLKEFGIRASKQGDQVSLTFKGVTTTVGNSANEITAYLQKLGNVDFAGAMATRAATLDGAISNLADSWDALFLTVSQNNAGGVIFDTVTLASGVIADATTIIKGMSGAAAENARDTGAMATIQGGLANVFETVAVLGANVKYVLVQVGTELGGLAAQAVQILQGNFAGAAAIRQSMIAEGEAARKDIDATTERILGARNAAKELSTWNTRNASAAADPRRLDGMVQATNAATSAVKKLSEAEKQAAKARQEEADLLARLSGYNADYEDQVNRLVSAKNSGRLAFERFNEEVAALVNLQPGAIKLTKDQAEAAKRNTQAVDDLFEAQEKLRLANEDQIKTGRTMLEQIEFETQLLGLNADQRAQVTMERELERQGIVKGTQAYDAYIDKLREAMAIKSAKEAGIESTEALAAANRKAAEESSKYWEDALMRAFESGKGFFESLWDTIKNTLKTQVLKVLVTGTMSGLGLTGAASAGNALSGVSGGLSLASGASSLFTVGSQVLGGTMSAANAGGTLIANATATGIDGLLATNAAYGTAVAGAAPAAGTGIASIVGAIPGWGWALAGVAAAAAIFGQGQGGPKTESGYGYGLVEGAAGSSRVVDGSTGPAAQYNLGIENTWGALAKSFGLSSELKVGSYTATDPQGDSPTQVQVVAGLDGKTVYNRFDRLGGNIENVGRTEEELQTAMSNEATFVIFNALRSSDLDQQYLDYLNEVAAGLPALQSEAEQVAAMNTALSDVAVVRDFTTALNSLPFEHLKNMGFNAAKGLIEAAGGLETLSANLSGYYNNFYTAAEKTAHLTTNTAASFADLGFTMPAVTTGLDDWYVGIVEATMAMDQSNPAVAQTTAGLLALGGSVATLGDTAASTQKLIDGIHTSATNTVWQMQYGMGTTQEQYGMWDVKIDDLDTQLHAATDINEIARLADEELKAIKSSWDLLSPDQQRASFGEYKQDIADVDTYVAQSGATPRDIQRADNQEFADIVATAVEKVMEKSAKAQQAAADAQAAAAANPVPVDLKITVNAPHNYEVDISSSGQ